MPAAYHHGSLRAALLTQGRSALAEQGAAGVSLRDLARRAGVSHAAPARHFPDREALLDALAADGFDELTAALQDAATAGDLRARLTRYARAHVTFAVDNPQLLQLMFSRKLAPGGGARPGGGASAADDDDAGAHTDGGFPGGPRGADGLTQAAGRFFALGAAMLGEPDGAAAAGAKPLPYLVAATFEGISALVTSGRLPLAQVGAVVDAAVEVLLPAVTDQLERREKRIDGDAR